MGKLEDGARLQKSNVNEISENSGVGEQEIGGEQEEKFGTKGREEIGLIGQPKREVSNT